MIHDYFLLQTKSFHRLACDSGLYGPGCETPCGHCFESDICHHINGNCPGNCSDGYSGDKCTDGEIYLVY